MLKFERKKIEKVFEREREDKREGEIGKYVGQNVK